MLKFQYQNRSRFHITVDSTEYETPNQAKPARVASPPTIATVPSVWETLGEVSSRPTRSLIQSIVQVAKYVPRVALPPTSQRCPAFQVGNTREGQLPPHPSTPVHISPRQPPARRSITLCGSPSHQKALAPDKIMPGRDYNRPTQDTVRDRASCDTCPSALTLLLSSRSPPSPSLFVVVVCNRPPSPATAGHHSL